MSTPIRVLILEDVPTDAELAEFELSRALGLCAFTRVETREEFVAALKSIEADLVVSDYQLPTFDGLAALRVVQDLCPETPFIMLTGSMNEDTAVECMKAGAWDYVIKEHIKRLGAAAKSALDLRQVRAERKNAEVSLRHSEQRLTIAQKLGRVGHWELEVATQKLLWSDAVYAIYARDPKLGPPSKVEEAAYYSANAAIVRQGLIRRAIETGEAFEMASTVHCSDGSVVEVTTLGSAMTDERGRVVRLLGTVQDVTERRHADARIRHLNSVVEAIRSINKLMIREREPHRLIQQACNLLVASRGFRGAWILKGGVNGHPVAWAQAGFVVDAEEMNRWVSDGKELPCWAHVRSQPEQVIVFDAKVSCRSCPLVQPLEHTVSVIAKLAHDGVTFGLLGVSFPPEWAVDEEEKALLGEFAADLAFALHDIELEQQRNRFAQIVASSKEAMALIGPDCAHLDANPAYAALVGAPKEHLLGQPVSSFVDPTTFETQFKPRLDHCFLGNAPEFETELSAADGTKRYLSAIMSPCLRDDSTVAAAAICIRDVTERKQAEAALRASENRYRMLAENAGVSISYYALDGTALFFNSTAAQAMGGSPSFFVGKSVNELYGDELGSLVLNRLQAVFVSRTVNTYEDEIQLFSEPSWYLSTYAAINDDSGQVVGVQIISTDITARKRAELDLQVERDNLGAFLAAVPAAILVVNRERELVHGNAEAEQLLGKPASAIVGRLVGELLGCAHCLEGPRGCGTGFGCDSCSLNQIVRSTIENRTSVHGQEVAIELADHPAGDYQWFAANAAPLSLKDGPGAVLALHNVTERKRSEEKLRFQTMLLESQNEASIDGILIHDARGKLLWHNRRFADLLHISAEDVEPGLDCAAMGPVLEQLENATEYQAKLVSTYADRTAKTHDELRLKDGRTLDHFGLPIIGEFGEYLGRVWLFRDITNVQQLRATVVQSDRLASMGMLAAGVAHEINNPLSYILYNLESLKDDLELQLAQSAELRASLTALLDGSALNPIITAAPNLFDQATLADMEGRFSDALSGTKRIKEIARGLGTFSRVEKDRTAPVGITRPIESALSIAFNEIKYRAKVEKELDSLSLVLASEGQLSQVFLNLLINAAHAIADGNVENNRIIIKTWEREGEVFASVEDSGCGIPQDCLERIFDPFFTTKPVGVGSGLGLNIVRSIITGFHGTIHVSSRVGKGTRFVVRLPMAHTTKPSSMLPPPLVGTNVGPKGRILLVDDEAQVRLALSRILDWHEVIQAAGGVEAQGILKQDQRFDLILCDIMMPQMSGIDLHRWLTTQEPLLAQRLVFVTGGAFTAGSSAYLQQIENESIEKPFDAETLRKQVTAWVAAAQSKVKG